MSWLVLTLELDDAHVEAYSEALLEAGAVSVALEDADAGTAAETPCYAEPGATAGRAKPGATGAPAAWRRNRVSALLGSQADARAVVARAAKAAGLGRAPEFGLARLEDEDWVRRTQSQFGPLRVGERVWIVPSWHEPPEPDATVIRLDPGLAFGTGSHPSTRLALRFLERVLRSARSDSGRASVLDYGCGSGILAIAAAKLGAGRVDAVDLDPQALEAAASNARANGLEVRVATPQALAPGEFDVVVANILANPLIALAPLLVARTRRGGSLALSGILESQAPEVIAAYAPEVGLAVGAADEGWVLLEGRRRASAPGQQAR
jgi:ribosomal protein L11 methyltransferase